jgi:hypothetical protein
MLTYRARRLACREFNIAELMMSMTNQVVCDDEYVDACPVRVG